MSNASSISKVMECLHVVAPIGAALLAPAVSSKAQSYNLFYTPQSSGNTVWAYCIDVSKNPGGQYNYWCPLNIFTGVYTNTNAHYHNTNRPWSSFACADPLQCSPSGGQYVSANTTWKGSVEVWIATTIVGQAEFIYASASGGSDFLDFVVGYNDLYYNDHPEIWMRTGGTDTGVNTGHGSTYYNRYMQADPITHTGPAYGLYYATLEYLAQHPGQQRICTNDMALPFGGKFDICAINGGGKPECQYQNKPWQSPHTAHDRGTAVDVAGPGSSQCLPDAYEVNVSDFIQRCVNNGANSQYSVPEGNHAHCNWANPNTYPH